MNKIKAWAVWFDVKYENDEKKYLPKLFFARSGARKFNISSHPKGRVVQVEIKVVGKK